jgi:hypothetical protein
MAVGVGAKFVDGQFKQRYELAIGSRCDAFEN